MKYIKKGKEPQTLTDKRNTEGAIYECAQKDWQEDLLKEQGHLCAYCMRRISLDRKSGKPSIEIEHYLSRKLYPDLSLRWENMIGVCNGDTGLETHCDKSKGKTSSEGVFVKGKANGEVKLNILNPLEINKSEKVITYSLSGEIFANVKDTELQNKITEDLDIILNLNDEKLKEYRKEAIDLAKKLLIDKYPTGNWTLKQIEREIEEWKNQKNCKYRPFCQAAIWFLEWRKTKLANKL
ncbi:retron system putative HNH endonuclease [Pseudanabaena yagii]|uniref:TIGR02646 family protein n=1 Tax=Pseudanabaena yagii GIHE-NHR1 TaxID=2722753 RepID=A0ABX1LYU3_9CYAN|nr:retron system putative HNH endonuclease [Pseudanabaena yagii]NMF60418.1 TIGR02646 family protein [Pseudanabaena yagii GIHE-NHR1]